MLPSLVDGKGTSIASAYKELPSLKDGEGTSVRDMVAIYETAHFLKRARPAQDVGPK